MFKRHSLYHIQIVCFALVILGCDNSTTDRSSSPPPLNSSLSVTSSGSAETIYPMPMLHGQDEDIALLGEQLFFDRNLSSNGSTSCASCHDLNRGGTDQLAKSPGATGQLSSVNTPTVFNARYNFKQFWDGRADSLEEQALGPLTNPKEMNNTWPDILAYVSSNTEYAAQFNAQFDSGVTKETILTALAVYQRTLITPNSPFDQFLNGDENAISEQAKHGFELFDDLGCSSCHQGVNVGGNMFQRIGVMGDYFADRGNVTEADFGLYNVTGIENDRYRFKVPSLRNIADTAPYFHDGSAATLPEAVTIMARYQLGIELPQSDVDLLVSFLQTLSAPPLEVRSTHASVSNQVRQEDAP